MADKKEKKFFSSKEFTDVIKKRKKQTEKIMKDLGFNIADPKDPAKKRSK